ncbi:WYL domain-containing protein [Candidatus Chloroploca sp. M-50]|uniref:WYL domain-containing protein n=1 Tax=Candidatus Chloroploca mongolica TaxID=2528176 RepID=A0ABS4DDF3_9CHLR|nr:exonuclease domain-containing protein [Candidatus Chloroploca mongolica]MBP1467476.1 WYL domain-containing protein [Candidatus Chloroploca mongolica]
MYDLNRPLQEVPLLFLDLETTGLSLGAGHRVCEVALLREENGQEQERFACLIDPGRPLDPGSAAVNGLNDAELAEAASFASVAPQIEAFAQGAILVAHNLAFDRAFLSFEMAQIGRPVLNGPGIDTLPLARRLLRRPSYGLKALTIALQLPMPTHRAMDDVIALRALFHHLRGLMEAEGITTLSDTFRLERGLRPETPEPEVPPVIAQALAEQRPLRIVYRSMSTPEPTARTVRPIYLSQEPNGLYLRAFCELRQNVRTFAITKIEAAELLD